MINPSAIGWIDKFFSGQTAGEDFIPQLADRFYEKIRATGFLYGHIITFDTPEPVDTKGWTTEEISKLALLNTLAQMYIFVNGHFETADFLDKAAGFYREMHPQGFNLLKKVLPDNTLSHELEGMIGERVQTNHDIISRNFSNIVTNALLFEDVLAFHKYLHKGTIPDDYLKKLEEAIVSVVSLALAIKTNKSKYDELLVRLFEASVRYTKFSGLGSAEMSQIDFSHFHSAFERFYLLEMAVLAIWSEDGIQETEQSFLAQLSVQLHISNVFMQESIHANDVFIQAYKTEIPYFNYSNPVKHFYDQATQTVTTLISRNKNRLVKELSNNGELMVLLTKSTHHSLDPKEKKKVKKQLLEICKTIPSLAIFLLPGGSLLLPILVKFIPQMLPAAFNENLEEE